MSETYSGPLLIHPYRYEFLLGTCRNSYFSMSPSRGKEHDASDTISLYKEAMREDVMKLGDPFANVRAPTQKRVEDC